MRLASATSSVAEDAAAGAAAAAAAAVAADKAAVLAATAAAAGSTASSTRPERYETFSCRKYSDEFAAGAGSLFPLACCHPPHLPPAAAEASGPSRRLQPSRTHACTRARLASPHHLTAAAPAEHPDIVMSRGADADFLAKFGAGGGWPGCWAYVLFHKQLLAWLWLWWWW